MQLADSFFPSGMFSMSNGLESYVKHNMIRTDDDILRFIKQQIEFQIIPCDCMVFLTTLEAAKNNDLSAIVDIDNRLYSMKLVKEIRSASVRSGSQILNCVIQMSSNKKLAAQYKKKIESKETPGTYPVCLGISANCFDIPKQSAVRMMLYSYCISVIGASIRLGITQHINGQRILTQLANDINILSKNIKKKPVANIWQLTPLTDILQMIHEHDDSRMFIT